MINLQQYEKILQILSMHTFKNLGYLSFEILEAEWCQKSQRSHVESHNWRHAGLLNQDNKFHRQTLWKLY